MAHCSSCGKFCRDNDIFCLNCGELLLDYDEVKLSSLNYDLEGEEFLTQVANELSSVSSKYANLMDDFTKSLDEYSQKIDNISKESQFAIYKARVQRMRDVFEGLTGVLENILISIYDVVFEMLVLVNIIWNRSTEELLSAFEKPYQNMIGSFQNLISSAKESKTSFESITVEYPNEDFDTAKANLLLRFDRFIIFHESLIRELKFIKDKHVNNNSMSIEDNHNHFCIYCGTPVDSNQNFCSECGKPIYRNEEPIVIKVASKYNSKITELEQEYNLKQSKAHELVVKLFEPNHMAYERFTTAITKSNNLFEIQVDIARKMADLDTSENPFVIKELDSKLKTLEAFIDKIEELSNELIIHMSSNKKDNDDINNLFDDMDDLIGSVRDY